MLASLNQNAKENTRLAREWLDKNDIPYEIDQRGKHPCFVLAREKRQQRVTFASSPSAYAGDRILKDVKAAALRLGYTKPVAALTRSTYTPTRRQRLIVDPIESLARRHRVHISYHHGGKHPYMLFERDGGIQKLPFASSHSDHRTPLNALSTARRIFNEMGWAPVQEEQKKPMVGLVSTGKGSMFDAQQASQGPASPVKVYRPGEPEADIMVAGIPLPTITKVARENAGKRGIKAPEYRAFLERRNEWLSKVFDKDPNTRWEDIVAAFDLAGYKTTQGALQQALNIYRKRHALSEPEKKRIVYPKPEVKVDMAAQLRILRDPPFIPDHARVAYSPVEAGGKGVPFAFREWSDKVRYPWAKAAFEVGATWEQVAEALRRAGNPISDAGAQSMDRRWRKEVYDAAEAAKPKPKPQPRPEPKPAAPAPVAREERPQLNPSSPDGSLTPMDKLLYALTSYIDHAVKERLGGMDFEALKKKAAKWDAYEQMKEAKRKLAALTDGDDD